MQTGDKVLALLGAKLACCVLLTLGATGALGGALVWLVEPPVVWIVAAALVAAIAAIAWRSGAAGQRDDDGRKRLRQKLRVTPHKKAGAPSEADGAIFASQLRPPGMVDMDIREVPPTEGER